MTADENDSLPDSVEYAGFWIRFGAALIDTAILLVVTLPLTMVIYGNSLWQSERTVMGLWDVVINWIFPAVAVIVFWRIKGATPGKMLLSIQVVDMKTGSKMSVRQSIIRYVGYIVSTIPLFLGFFWIGIDKKKQSWHDKIARTVVVRIRKETE
ncbi:MAG: RDD family protein [Endozoicomonas sp.]